MKRYFLTLLCSLAFAGCATKHAGSNTVVGEEWLLPEIRDSSETLAIRIFESVKGARIWTAKDSRVTITYTNIYTNTYFGLLETESDMRLVVEVEPLEVAGE